VKFALLAAALVACAGNLVPPCAAGNPLPYGEIVASVRRLAASNLDRKPSEINTVQPLAAQGLDDRRLNSLIIDIQQEFGVVLSTTELQQTRWNDAHTGLSVRQLAQMVERRMREQP